MDLIDRIPLRKRVKYSITVGGVAIGLAVWYGMSSAMIVPEYLIPKPVSVVTAAGELIDHGILSHTGYSLLRVILGTTFGLLIVTPIAVWAAVNQWVDACIDPLLSALKFIPLPAFVPLSFFWFGLGHSQKLSLVTLGIVLQMFAVISSQVRGIERQFVEIGSAFGLSNSKILFRIILPRISPVLFETFRISIVLSWIYLMFAEMTSGDKGLGFLLMEAQRYVRTDRVIAVITLIGVVGFSIDKLCRITRAFLFPWDDMQRAIRQEDVDLKNI